MLCVAVCDGSRVSRVGRSEGSLVERLRDQAAVYLPTTVERLSLRSRSGPA